MPLAAIVLALAVAAARVPPLPPPPTPPPRRHSSKIVVTGLPQSWYATWKLPPGATNYFWSIETSTNLRDWVTLVPNASGPLTILNPQTNQGPRFYRARGRLNP